MRNSLRRWAIPSKRKLHNYPGMKNVFFFFCSISLICCPPVFAQKAREMTIEQCLEYALGNNESIQISELSIEDAEAKIRGIVALGLPQASIQGGLNYNYEVQTSLVDASNFDRTLLPGTLTEIQFALPYDGNVNMGVRQLIFDGAYFVGIEASKTFKELSVKENERTKIEVVEAVTKSYYNVLINQAQLYLLGQNFSRLDTLLRETTQMYRNGFVEQIDVDRIKVSYNNIKVNLETQIQLSEISQKLLKFQMGMPLDDPIVLTTSLRDVNLDIPDVSTNFNYSDRIEYSLLETNRNLALLDKKKSSSEYLPKIYGSFNYGLNNARGLGRDLLANNWFNFGTVGATISIPLFEGFSKKIKIQQSKIKISQLDYQKSFLQKNIEIEIVQQRMSLEGNLKILEVQRQNQELAANIFRITKIKFQEGIGSNLELTNADNEYKTAQTNYLNTLYKSILSKIDLLKATGTLYNTKL